jgi:chaperone protein EcpD
MTNLWRFAMAGALAFGCTFAGRSDANVIIDGTRVFYRPQDKEATVKMTNTGKKPVMVQAWIDGGAGQATPDNAKAPFTLTPPIFRLDPDKAQAIRVLYTQEPLPADKETLFWFSVLEVPAKASNPDGRNILQFSVRTRIKFLYRPPGLPGSAAAAPDQLTWKLVPGEGGKGIALQASNPTPYYVNFAHVGLSVAGHRYMQPGGGMVAPGQTAEFPIKQLDSRPSGEVKAVFDAINDLGAIGEHEKPINS